MKYVVTLNGNDYEVEVNELNEAVVTAVVPSAAPVVLAAPVAPVAAPVAAPVVSAPVEVAPQNTEQSTEDLMSMETKISLAETIKNAGLDPRTAIIEFAQALGTDVPFLKESDKDKILEMINKKVGK